jgi:hypothetical protein
MALGAPHQRGAAACGVDSDGLVNHYEQRKSAGLPADFLILRPDFAAGRDVNARGNQPI